MITDLLKTKIKQSIDVKELALQDTQLQQAFEEMATACLETLKSGGKILFCGNGGSAADAQHLAAELSGRFYKDRPPLYAEALHVNTSYLTAVANDYSYDEIYARLVKGKGLKGDVLIAISTSGNSKNIIKAVEQAHEMGIKTIGWTGSKPSKLQEMANICISIPSSDTPRIQECHILIGHILCEYIENQLF
ncbi:MAG: D-sedoheptulose 7-phosphate isomerase [Saprospiraceae bacterium]|nr:D-sedoheptulose 7-phosphate isomerase [Saprospiraceae bacterium]